MEGCRWPRTAVTAQTQLLHGNLALVPLVEIGVGHPITHPDRMTKYAGAAAHTKAHTQMLRLTLVGRSVGGHAFIPTTGGVQPVHARASHQCPRTIMPQLVHCSAKGAASRHLLSPYWPL
jgi:hypothetical protein